jgi:hypothetical protein
MLEILKKYDDFVLQQSLEILINWQAVMTLHLFRKLRK